MVLTWWWVEVLRRGCVWACVQVKQCYTHGIEPTGKGGKVVSRLLNSAVAAGKRVRSETGESPEPRMSPHTPLASPTAASRGHHHSCLLVPHAPIPFLHSTHAGISKGAVSISSAAVEFSEVRTPKDIGKEFEDCRIAIVGAGKMSRLLMIHMASQGIKQVTLMNRCVRACALRRCIACGPHASLHDARCDPHRCTYHDPSPPLLPSLAHHTLFQILDLVSHMPVHFVVAPRSPEGASERRPWRRSSQTWTWTSS